MDSVGGYRLVRRLGGGSSSDVWLTVADPPRADTGPAEATTGRCALVTKVFLPSVRAERVDGEVRMLASVEHPHLVRLVDVVTTTGSHPSLVLQRHDPGGLHRLLSTRRLDPGECITILAPVIDVVRVIHDEGLSHGRLSTAGILLADDGGPVVLGGPGAEHDVDQRTACAVDRRMLAELSDQVLGAADRGQGRVSGLRSWLRSSDTEDRFFLDRFEEHLFSVGEPRPVLEGPINVDGTAVPATSESLHGVGMVDPMFRMPLLAQVVDDSRVTSRRERRPERRSPRLAGVALDSIRSGTAALRRAWGELRRGFRILAVVGMVCVTALGFALLVPGSSSSEAAGTSDGGPHTAATADPNATLESAAAESDVAPSIPSGKGIEERSQTPSETSAEDPVAAAITLLSARDVCMAERSVVCLESVVQPGSPASVTEPERIRLADRAPVAPLLADGVQPELVSALGGVVILSIPGGPGETQPASVLMIWTEAGWRLRDVFSD